MERIHVNLGSESYDITIDRGLLDRMGPLVRLALPQAEKLAVITDDTVDGLYGERFEKVLRGAGYEVRRIAVPHGEGSKNLRTLGEVLEAMSAFGMTRSDGVVTLSGGVPGDLGGFAAAVYLRGVPFVQVPTTILAQIDSSVGGKVAVDLPSGKNLAGSFYQPKAVLIDPELVRTLAPRYIHDGMAEAVKYGCIHSESLFRLYEGLHTDEDIFGALPQIIRECCRIKAELVEEDVRDNGARMLLNFGHTIGHAIEREYHYETYTHGEAVAAGMVLLTRRTEALGLTAKGTADRIERVLRALSLPVAVGASASALLPHIAHDKKKRGRRITFVALRRIGESFLLPVEGERISELVETGV